MTQRSSSKDDLGPDRLALHPNLRHDGAHRPGQRAKINAAVVPIGVQQAQSFFDALDCGTPLAGLGVKNPDAELEKDANEIGLVANAFEEKLLEELAGLEKIALVEEGDSALKAGVVDQICS